MSFSFGDDKSPFALGSEPFDALKNLIEQNPYTLFSVSAGNGSQDLDSGKDFAKEFPASFSMQNVLSVGALNTDAFKESQAPTYKPTDFSAHGKVSVDLFAPGKEVLGGSLGNHWVRTSGTSMAAPYALNVAILIAESYPKLSTQILKQILLYSAYIPNLKKPLNCVSGGMLFPRRAFAMAKLVALKGLSLKNAALEVRKKPHLLLQGEENSVSYREELLQYWNQNF